MQLKIIIYLTRIKIKFYLWKLLISNIYLKKYVYKFGLKAVFGIMKYAIPIPSNEKINMNFLLKILPINAPIFANTPYIKLYIKLYNNKIAMLNI